MKPHPAYAKFVCFAKAAFLENWFQDIDEGLATWTRHGFSWVRIKRASVWPTWPRDRRREMFSGKLMIIDKYFGDVALPSKLKARSLLKKAVILSLSKDQFCLGKNEHSPQQAAGYSCVIEIKGNRTDPSTSSG
jgi:hypothetical protein